jgi:hypothetical protein
MTGKIIDAICGYKGKMEKSKGKMKDERKIEIKTLPYR